MIDLRRFYFVLAIAWIAAGSISSLVLGDSAYWEMAKLFSLVCFAMVGFNHLALGYLSRANKLGDENKK